MANKMQGKGRRSGSAIAKNQKQRMQPALNVLKPGMKRVFREERGKGMQRSNGNIGKKRSGSSPGVMISLTGKGGRTRSVTGKNLYKSSIQKAKEALRIKTRETGLANKIEQKRIMARSLMATKKYATGTESSYRLLKMRRNQLMFELDAAFKDLVRFRTLETLLMLELGFL